MKHLFLSISLVALFSCEEEKVIEQENPNWTPETSSTMHAVFAEEEDQEIENFLGHRPDWKVTKTGTGLRVFVYSRSGNSDTARVGDQVLVDFNIELLDGTECYNSGEKGPEAFIVEKSDLESGLHEGMQHMCTGDKAKFILPSHLAHGLIGDSDKIPPLTPVIYDIHCLEIAHQIQTHE